MTTPLSEKELLAMLIEWKRKHGISDDAMREFEFILNQLGGGK